MCLYLIGSQFKNIQEVEYLMNNPYKQLTETQILDIKDNRKAINKELKKINSAEYIEMMGI